MDPYDYKGDKLYSELIGFVLNSEGGYVNDPHDPGGPTKYGIAWNYNQGILKSLDVHDVKNLTLEQAKQVYFVKYWLASGSNLIPDKRLAYIHFDAAVNSGIGGAAKFLMGLSTNPKFLKAGDSAFYRLFCEYFNARLRAYTHDKNRAHYLEGWVNRMIGVMDRAIKF